MGLPAWNLGGGVLVEEGVFGNDDLTDALREELTYNTKLRDLFHLRCPGFNTLWKLRRASRAKGSKSEIEWLAFSTEIELFQWEKNPETGGYEPPRHYKFNPVLVALNDYTGDSGHFTTVVRVDLENKIVVHNTWGKAVQDTLERFP